MPDVNTDALSTLPLVLGALLAALAGHAIGSRRARRSRRDLRRTLGTREIELLESRAEVARLAESLASGPRREHLLRLAMTRLRDTRERERRLFVELARQRLAAVEASARFRQAVRLAGRASTRVRELEAASGTAGTVRGVDHGTREARRDGAGRVPLAASGSPRA